MRKFLLFLLFISFSFFHVYATGVTLRVGQGGLFHEDAPGNNIGGGQIALDFKVPVHSIVYTPPALYTWVASA